MQKLSKKLYIKGKINNIKQALKYKAYTLLKLID